MPQSLGGSDEPINLALACHRCNERHYNFLRPTGYEQIKRSELLPNLDIQRLASYFNPADQFESVMAFREMLRG